MDRVVIDSSVAIKWFVPEANSADARKLLDGFQAGTLELLAPDLLNAEIGNIVWKKQVLRGELSAADAQLVLDNYRALKLPLTPTADLLDAAFRLAVAHQRTVYDCLYVALSIRENCPFVTSDERLVNAVSAAIPGVIWLPHWP
jgi:predicted nucleic acid-binding protein